MNAPFHFDQAVSDWRTETSGTGGLRDCDLDELEGHLRDAFAELRSRGLADEEAFHLARRRLGGAELAREFAKVHLDAIWAERGRWALIGALGFKILWDGLGSGGNLIMLLLGAVFRTPLAFRCGYWISAIGTIVVFVLVLVRLVRGQWRSPFSGRLRWLCHPSALAGLLVVGFLIASAIRIFFVNFMLSTVTRDAFYSLMRTSEYLGLAVGFAAFIALAVAAAMANRRRPLVK
jgi:hypothetical protein